MSCNFAWQLPPSMLTQPVVIATGPGGTGAATLYPRIVSVHRQKTVAGTTDNIGLGGYSGEEQSISPSDVEGEVVLYTGLPAAIAARTSGRTKGTLLPGDIVFKPAWTISIPIPAITIYSIRDRDIIIDDENYRYAVGSNYWTGLGYQLDCVRLET